MNKFFRIERCSGLLPLVHCVIAVIAWLGGDGHEWLYIILAPLMLPLLIVVMRTKDKGG